MCGCGDQVITVCKVESRTRSGGPFCPVVHDLYILMNLMNAWPNTRRGILSSFVMSWKWEGTCYICLGDRETFERMGNCICDACAGCMTSWNNWFTINYRTRMWSITSTVVLKLTNVASRYLWSLQHERLTRYRDQALNGLGEHCSSLRKVGERPASHIGLFWINSSDHHKFRT